MKHIPLSSVSFSLLVACGAYDDLGMENGDEPPLSTSAPPSSQQAAVAANWDPGLQMSRNANEWWVEVLVNDPQTARVRLERRGGGTLELRRMPWGAFAANERVPRGTSVRLLITHRDGTQAQTQYFAFLRQQPSMEQSAPPANPTWDPGFNLSTNCNAWWIEAWIADARVVSVRVELESGTTFALGRTAWGSFAVNRSVPRGTSLRLVIQRDDGTAVATSYFEYLNGSPVLGETNGETENPNNPDGPDGPGEPEQPSGEHGTFYVRDGAIYDPCGREVILRGINKMSVWTDPQGSSFPHIARTGANTVRIVWSTSGSPSGLNHLITRARDEGLLPMVELHDATGDFSRLGSLVNYWVRPDVVSVLQAHESALLVNIGNEVGDWNVTDSQFQSGYRSAIDRMRAVGIRAPLVIDSRGWAQDVDFLLANGPQLLAHDPLHNVIFAAHFYSRASSSNHFRDLFRRVVDAKLPFVVGEFADSSASCSLHQNYRLIMAAAEEYQIGWYAWSWGPGNTPCASMDMTSDGTYATLRGWGYEVALSDPNSIRNTAEPIATQDEDLCL